MKKLEKIAKRIFEISVEIKDLKLQRDSSIKGCISESKEFLGFDCYDRSDLEIMGEFGGSCLMMAYQAAKISRTFEGYETTTFSEILEENGCDQCKSAHKLKGKIGRLKMERGRLLGNITTIGSRI